MSFTPNPHTPLHTCPRTLTLPCTPSTPSISHRNTFSLGDVCHPPRVCSISPFRPCPTEVSQVSLPASPSTSPVDPVLQTLKLTRGFPSFDVNKSSLFFRSFKIRTDHKEQRTCMPECEKRGNSYLIFKPAFAPLSFHQSAVRPP